jgi:hypothetical protein
MSGILYDVDAPEQWRERLQREQQVRHSLRVAADRLESAERERVANIAAAHHAGLSVRQIAAAVQLSPARVHQLLHAPVSSAAVRATTMRWDSSRAVATQGPTTQADAGSRVPLAGIAALLRECTEWLDRLDREEFVAVNLREATDPQTEYVAADRAQVRQVLQEIAGEIEGLAAGSTPANDEAGVSRRERLAPIAEARPAQSTRGAHTTPPAIRFAAAARQARQRP